MDCRIDILKEKENAEKRANAIKNTANILLFPVTAPVRIIRKSIEESRKKKEEEIKAKIAKMLAEKKESEKEKQPEQQKQYKPPSWTAKP